MKKCGPLAPRGAVVIARNRQSRSGIRFVLELLNYVKQNNLTKRKITIIDEVEDRLNYKNVITGYQKLEWPGINLVYYSDMYRKREIKSCSFWNDGNYIMRDAKVVSALSFNIPEANNTIAENIVWNCRYDGLNFIILNDKHLTSQRNSEKLYTYIGRQFTVRSCIFIDA
ncbi:MAG: hypothetical protein GY750_01920 [Lentisphaerae bacterium]|nr:hypothetical protein [Lentisphaerota bacterium]MCP4100178.1 hypothetical protein [Lentisphaerota bacterium]